ncbi:MAG: hypothetical protein GEU89_21705 [Kiloniellaceae bacterium]|nr:hypothetical protein [Kiloniellaceae bacterium]
MRFAIGAEHVERIARLGGDTLAEIPLQAETRRLMLVPSYLYTDAGQPLRLQNLGATILLRTRDWP